MGKSGYDKPDRYSKKAKQEGYHARSVYKLEEIDKKYQVFRNGLKVLDLGAYPGSWSQYALKKVGPTGKVVGIDIENLETSLGSNYTFLHRSILEAELDLGSFAPFDVVLSDMAPRTTGIKSQDVYLSLELTAMAAQSAEKYMKHNGVFIAKIFQGEDFDEFYKDLRTRFAKMKSIKPEAVRAQSKEIYVIAWGLK